MKHLLKIAVFALAIVNIGCPKDNPAPASLVGTPNTQCLSSIPTGAGGTIGYPQSYPYNNNCYAYGANGYFQPYNYGYYNGFRCPNGTIAAYGYTLGLSCVATYGLPTASLLYYSYLASGAFGYANYGYYNSGWSSYYAVATCTSSYPGCNCVPTGYPSSGIGICTSY